MADAWNHLAAAFALLGLPKAEATARKAPVPADSGEMDRACASMVEAMRAENGSPVLLQLQALDCRGSSDVWLEPDVPALVLYREGAVLSLRVPEPPAVGWLFFSSSSGEVSGSIPLEKGKWLEVPLPPQGPLILVPSLRLRLDDWSIR